MNIDLSRYLKLPPNHCPYTVGDQITVRLGACAAPYFDLTDFASQEIVFTAGGDQGCDLIITDSLTGGGHVTFVSVYPQKQVVIPPNKLNPLYIIPSGPQGKTVWVSRYAVVGQPSPPVTPPKPGQPKPNIKCVNLTYKVSGENEGVPVVKFTAYFYNFGGSGSQKFTIYVDGKAVGSFYVTLNKGGQTSVSFVLELVGRHTVCVGGKCVTVNVKAPPAPFKPPSKTPTQITNTVVAGVATGLILLGIRELFKRFKKRGR